MELYTQRLVLRPWTQKDAPSLFEYAKDPAVGPIAGWPPHTSVSNSEEIIKNVLAVNETYAVCMKEDNIAIGSIGLMIGKASNLDLAEDEGEIGYWIGVPFWGQGLIPEACDELIRHAFEDLELSKLWCGYFEGNMKSKRVQEKCGFKYHHTNKNVHWKLMDDIRTEHINCLTRTEWEKTRKGQLIDIRPLDAQEFKGKKYQFKYQTPGYYDLIADQYSFEFVYKEFECMQKRGFEDELLGDWLEQPVLYGAYKGEQLAGLIEGSMETWNNRFRISNILVFDEFRNQNIGSEMMAFIFAKAKKMGARMVVLETQSCNIPAIRCYQKNGFKIIGFDTHAYSNRDIENREVRMEMGREIL